MIQHNENRACRIYGENYEQYGILNINNSLSVSDEDYTLLEISKENALNKELLNGQIRHLKSDQNKINRKFYKWHKFVFFFTHSFTVVYH